MVHTPSRTPFIVTTASKENLGNPISLLSPHRTLTSALLSSSVPGKLLSPFLHLVTRYITKCPLRFRLGAQRLFFAQCGNFTKCLRPQPRQTVRPGGSGVGRRHLCFERDGSRPLPAGPLPWLHRQLAELLLSSSSSSSLQLRLAAAPTAGT